MARERRSWYSGGRNLLLCFLLCAFSASVSAQTIAIVPEVDSLCLWGTCTPPGFICRLVDCGQRVSRVVVHPCGAMLLRGSPPNLILRSYDSIYFEIANTLPSNGFEVFLTNHSSFYPAHFRVVFDSSIFVLAGPCDLSLYVLRKSSVVDSAIIRFTSYQTGLSVGDDQSLVPPNYSLFQNYPNPFNPKTKIQFIIVNRQSTIVKVFDVLGRDLATLVNEVKEPGMYTVQFDGSNLASGAYFYQLQAGEFIQIRKLLLLR